MDRVIALDYLDVGFVIVYDFNFCSNNCNFYSSNVLPRDVFNYRELLPKRDDDFTFLWWPRLVLVYGSKLALT